MLLMAFFRYSHRSSVFRRLGLVQNLIDVPIGCVIL